MSLSALNPRSPVPLYQQLADALTRAIQRGEFSPGSRLPSEPALALQHGITRPTVRQATELLVQRQLVERRRGAGTFVLEPSNHVDLLSLSGTADSFAQQGLPVSSKLCSPLAERAIDERDEGPFAGQRAYTFSRLHRLRKRPVLLEEMQLSLSHFPELGRFNLEGASLSRIVREDYRMVPTSATQHFRVQCPSTEQARLLRVAPHTPLLVVQRHLHFGPAQSAIFCRLYCRTDELTFSQTLHA